MVWVSVKSACQLKNNISDDDNIFDDGNISGDNNEQVLIMPKCTERNWYLTKKMWFGESVRHLNIN